MEKTRRDPLRHPLSLLGAGLATITGVLITALILASFVGLDGGPYIGLVAFVILPTFLVIALVLIPVGAWLERRRQHRQQATGEPIPPMPVFDFNQPRVRKLTLAFLALTTVNVLLLAGASYKGLEVMDSPKFCGSCHSVMDPEASAHARSPHSRVRCVDCHIGPGASWFVKSKLSGSWQLVSVTLGLYPKPIPTPVKNLRPARDTCEECHWPTKFVGDRLKVITKHENDVANTPTQTVLLLHVGGQQGTRTRGIHWHVDPGVKIRFQADPKREKIYQIELSAPGDVRRTYETKEKPGADAAWREMDCVDCHNRPTHIYRTAEDEVDGALASGHVDGKLPFIRREALKALKAEYPSQDAARAGIKAALEAFYAKEAPDVLASQRAALDAAVTEVGAIYARNVWPQMKITWGTYPSFLGHEQAPGCFRCHDGEHATQDGRAISNDCDLCHQVLAQEEKDPAILKALAP